MSYMDYNEGRAREREFCDICGGPHNEKRCDERDEPEPEDNEVDADENDEPPIDPYEDNYTGPTFLEPYDD